MNNSKILVIGGAGFVGSNLCKIILNNYKKTTITVVDNLLSSESENLPVTDRINLIEGSITDQKVLDQITDVYDYIFHLATFHGNQSSIHDPIADHENNTLTTLKLMNYVRNFSRLKKLVYSSAGCSVAKKTYDSTTATTEDAPIALNQDSPYSISKVIGEFYAVYFFKQHGLPTVRARFQNVYGPGEVLGAGRWRGTPATIWRNVVPGFIYRSMKHEELPLHNAGEASRDFIFVTDICKGLIACALKGKPGDVYNLASGNESTILDLARTINQITGNPTSLKLLPKREWDTSGRRYGSTDKAKRELGFESEVDLPTGLNLTIQWTRKNLDFIEKILPNTLYK